MEKEFRLHLRLTEKDRDLCRWRHSVKNKMLTYYICQILTAEMRGEIAFLHGFKGMSANDEPCDIFMRVKDPDIIGFIAAMPENRQNATIKNIIRKHLYSQTAASGNLFFSPVPFPQGRKLSRKKNSLSLLFGKNATGRLPKKCTAKQTKIARRCLL